MTDSSVLVTGSSGFIGGHIVEQMAAAGFTVTGVDIRAPRKRVSQRAHTLMRHFADPVILASIVDGRYKTVVHQAGITDTLSAEPVSIRSANVDEAVRLAEACRAGGAMYIYASSWSVYGRVWLPAAVSEGAVTDRGICSGPLSLYARSKLALERRIDALSQDGLRAIGLRYTNVFGEGEGHKGRMASILSQILARASNDKEITLYSDTLLACRDYVPVELVARTVSDLAATAIPDGVYNLGSGHALSFAKLLEWCAELAGGRLSAIRLIPNPIVEQYQYWTCAELSKLRRAMPSFTDTNENSLREAVSLLYESFERNSRDGRWQPDQGSTARKPTERMDRSEVTYLRGDLFHW